MPSSSRIKKVISSKRIIYETDSEDELPVKKSKNKDIAENFKPVCTTAATVSINPKKKLLKIIKFVFLNR